MIIGLFFKALRPREGAAVTGISLGFLCGDNDRSRAYYSI